MKIIRRSGTGRDQETAGRRRMRLAIIIGALIGFLMATDLAVASNWTAGLNAGSSGEAESTTVTNLTISAVATPSPTNLLYPGSTGDVVLTISNPNPFPVTLTALSLPANTTYATGYSDSALTLPNLGCTAATSLVYWNYATALSGSSHTLTTALVVAASGAADNPLTVTLTNDAAMGSASPSGCESTYFSMPSLTGITASAGGTPVTTSPTTDAWTS